MRSVRFSYLFLGLIAGVLCAQTVPAPALGSAPEFTPPGGSVVLKRAVVPRLAGSWLDLSQRVNAQRSFINDLLPSEGYAMGFTGDVSLGIAGMTAQSYRDAVLSRVNWFRAMAGVPAVLSCDAEKNRKSQLGALMLAANQELNHHPPTSWLFYSVDGANALANSNICLGFDSDPGCLATYMQDHGAPNAPVGHRRWILYPQTTTMGTGDALSNNPFPAANVLWVVDAATYSNPRPSTRDNYVAWPPPGYVPYEVVWPRWSFSYPGANFGVATVTMTRNGSPISVRLETISAGTGESTLVWVPDNKDANTYNTPAAPASDTTYYVTLGNVLINGSPQSFAYDVIVFNPYRNTDGSAVFTVDPSSINAGYASGSYSVDITTSRSDLSWYGNTDASWITFNTRSGYGSGTLSFTTATNTSSLPRLATISVAGQLVTVVQDGTPIAYTLQPSSLSVGPAAGSGTINITPNPSDGSWYVSGWHSPITFNGATSGTGPGTLSFNYTANSSLSSRTLNIVIGGTATFTLTQAGTSIPTSLNPASASLPASGGTGSVSVTGTLASYTAVTGQTWIHLTSGASGNVPGTISYSADANPSSLARFGVINVNGLTFTLTQAGASGSSAGLRFLPVSPCRLVDTRNPAGSFGGPYVAGGTTRTFVIPSSSCSIPSTAQAYALNVTVVPHGSLGYLTIWPAGSSQPFVSTLNSLDGRIKANAAIVPAGTNGGVTVYADNDTDVVIDINGYFVSGNSSALSYYPLAPCRVADTRNAAGSFGGPALAGGAQSRTIPMSASSCVPAGASAYSLNVTAVPAGALGYVTVYPTGSARPNVSTLNALTGAITANNAIIPAGANGSIDLYASDNTNVVVDITGYFATAGTGAQSLYTVAPCRVYDSRNAPNTILNGSRVINVSGSSCTPPSSASAYSLNATVVPSGALGYLTLWAAGGVQPFASTLNALDGSITSNAAFVPASAGQISAYTTSASHLVIDINGYFAP